MGLSVNGTQFILYARTLGVDFTRTAMIGRQGLHLSPAEFKANLLKFGFSWDESLIKRIFSGTNPYAEEFFRSLGAKEVHSFDNSDYEGATRVHDMNIQIPESFKQRYSVVLDGGSLEHIFNFPVAIKNCMEMVRVGGYYLGIAPANNFMGHGFYQFSPEVFFSIFTRSNGYELQFIIAFEDNSSAKWYLVKSPLSINGRVTLTNSRPVNLLIMAKRIENTEPFQSAPQQSDYTSAWNYTGSDVDAPLTPPGQHLAKRNTLLAIALRYIPPRMKRLVRGLVRYVLVRCAQQHLGFDPKFFTPLVQTDVTKSPAKS